MQFVTETEQKKPTNSGFNLDKPENQNTPQHKYNKTQAVIKNNLGNLTTLKLYSVRPYPNHMKRTPSRLFTELFRRIE